MKGELSSANGLIRAKALELGFAGCAVMPARFLAEEEERFSQWIDAGMHGEMGYLERNRDMRLDPSLLMEGARTVIIVLQNYYSPDNTPDAPETPVISRYARGKDYHQVIKRKLQELLRFIQIEITPCNGRPFTDSAPILERAWGRKAGLGWIGKNSMLISPRYGSYFFIGELIIDAEIPPATTDFTEKDNSVEISESGISAEITENTSSDNISENGSSGEISESDYSGEISENGYPGEVSESDCSGEISEIGSSRDISELADRCGSCTRCIDACPTRAIIAPRIIDARRCISYQTIELMGEQDPQLIPSFQNRLFGCDICQEVCPWNRKAKPHDEPLLNPKPEIMELTRNHWENMSETRFNQLFAETPLMRRGYEGIMKTFRNLQH